MDIRASICRGCLGEVQPGQDYSFIWSEICELFADCTTIPISEIQDDTYPQQICAECYYLCEQWFAFKKMCLEVNSHLKVSASTALKVPPGSFNFKIKVEPIDDYTPEDPEPVIDADHQLVEEEEELQTKQSPPSITSTSMQPVVLVERMGKKAIRAITHPKRQLFYVCHFCPGKFANTDHLHDHAKMHVPDGAKSCTICKKKFVSRSKVIRHMNQTHTPKESNDIVTPTKKGILTNCPLCKGKFPSLVDHILADHKERGKRICPICDYFAPDNSAFKGHLSKHTGERLYPCSTCKATYRYRSTLFAHKCVIVPAPMPLTIKSETSGTPRQIKREKVDTPGTGRAVKKEKKTCDATKCTQCRLVFPDKKNLRRHMKTHKKRKTHPVECPDCGNSFVSERSLIQHLAWRPSERRVRVKKEALDESVKQEMLDESVKQETQPMLPCSHCEKMFLYTVTLAEHVNNRHMNHSDIYDQESIDSGVIEDQSQMYANPFAYNAYNNY